MPYKHPIELPPGKGSCGCRGCGEVFTCVSAFDQHQTLRPEDQGGGVICHDPDSRKLVLYERPDKTGSEAWLIWGWPAQEAGSAWYDTADEAQGEPQSPQNSTGRG